MLPDCRSCLSKPVYTENSAKFLHAVPVKHDPYTPDSMDSPSPRALVLSGDIPDVDLLDDYPEEADTDGRREPRVSSASKRTSTAVSPTLLKSKLELIVQSKKQRETTGCGLSSRADKARIKKSPSECDLQSLSMINKDEDTRNNPGVRKNRSQSDVSWQRSHLLTQAWVQGGGQQAYSLFRSDASRKSFSSSNSLELIDGVPDLIIPRIAIINPSNFESNESSVHIHDDRHSAYSDTRLSTYSENRTKTMSGEASSLEKSDDVCSRIYEERDTNEEGNFQSRRTFLIQNRSNSNDRDKFEDKLKGERLTKNVILLPQSTVLFTENTLSKEEYDRCVIKTEGTKEEGNILSESELAKLNEVDENELGIDKNRKNLTTELEVKGLKESDVNKKYVKEDKDSIESSKASEMPKITESQRSDVNVINVNANTYNVDNLGSTNETEVSGSESRREVFGSRNTTRSNSTQSQDSNLKLGLTARRVTEKCKNDIAREKGKCKRCCCVVS